MTVSAQAPEGTEPEGGTEEGAAPAESGSAAEAEAEAEPAAEAEDSVAAEETATDDSAASTGEEAAADESAEAEPAAPVAAEEEATAEEEPVVLAQAEPAAAEPEEADVSVASEEADVEAAPVADAEVEEIVVTGSRIKRTSFDTPTPVQVLNREAIAKTGASNMADLIRFLTANSGSETQAGLGQGSTGTSQFNLRNLGVANTLVLLNGRRMVAYPDNFGVAHGSMFTDVNQIPLAFVERIEIAKGGASAIYGSDAIAGVVNIILRKDYEGFGISATGFTTDNFDQQDGEVSVIVGANSEKTSVVAQFSYFRRTPLAASDREYTDNSLISYVGNPGSFLLFQPDGSLLGFAPDPNCDQGEGSFTAGDRCAFDYQSSWDLYNKEERYLGYAMAEHRVSDAFQIFGELGYARKGNYAPQSPSYPSTAYFPTIFANHPAWPQEFKDQYPTAAGGVFYGRPYGNSLGEQRQIVEVDGFRAVGGLKGDLDSLGLDRWTWDAAVTWHLNKLSRRTPDVVIDNYAAAVDACNAGTEGCFNPFYPTAAYPADNTDLAEDLYGTLIADITNTLVVGEASIGGPLFALPGGDAAVAVGVQGRRNISRARYDKDGNDFRYAYLYGLADWGGVQSVVAGYGELALPVLPGVEIQGALRAEHYLKHETTINPRLAASWALDKTFFLPEGFGFRLRGSVGSAFRAPNIAQTNQAGISLAQVDSNGPLEAGGTEFRTSVTAPNKDLKPEKSTAFSLGTEITLETGDESRLRLDGDFWQYDITDLIILENPVRLYNACRDNGDCSAIDGESLATPDAKINVTYRNQSELTARGLDFDLSYQTGLGGMGDLSVALAGSYMINYLVPEEDVADIPVADDEGNVSLVQAPDCDNGKCDVAGTRNYYTSGPRSMPRLRARPSVAWVMDGHAVNVAGNFISAYDDDQNIEDGKYSEIPAWFTIDLSYGYSLGETAIGTSTQVRVGVNNLLDTAPPYLGTATNFGYDIFVHDPRGRILYANLSHKF